MSRRYVRLGERHLARGVSAVVEENRGASRDRSDSRTLRHVPMCSVMAAPSPSMSRGKQGEYD